MMKNTLRWIAVLPGATIGTMLINFPIHWGLYLLYNYFRRKGEDSLITTHDGENYLTSVTSFESIERTVLAFMNPLLFTVIAGNIAPKYKYVTSIIAAGVWLLMSMFLLTYYGLFAINGYTLVLLIAGCSLGVLLTKRRQED